MLKKSLILVAVALACAGAQAQNAASSPAKKELVAKILKLQQPGIEGMARNLIERSAGEVLARAAPVVAQRLPKEKHDAVAKEIEADARKYVNDMTPLVKDRAVKLAPTTVGTFLDEKFTEDELKQVLAMMESPVYAKFQGLGGEMQNVLVDKLVADTRGQVEVKLRGLEESIAKRVGLAPASGGAAAPAPAAPAASKPKK